MSVVNKILELMENESINARKLTTDLGLSNSAITEWKKGKARPSLEAVVKIARYFGVTTDSILFEDSVKEQYENREKIAGKTERDTDETGPPGLDCDFLRSSASEDEKILNCYHRLSRADQEYILCKLIVLERETAD